MLADTGVSPESQSPTTGEGWRALLFEFSQAKVSLTQGRSLGWGLLRYRLLRTIQVLVLWLDHRFQSSNFLNRVFCILFCANLLDWSGLRYGNGRLLRLRRFLGVFSWYF